MFEMTAVKILSSTQEKDSTRHSKAAHILHTHTKQQHEKQLTSAVGLEVGAFEGEVLGLDVGCDMPQVRCEERDI